MTYGQPVTGGYAEVPFGWGGAPAVTPALSPGSPPEGKEIPWWEVGGKRPGLPELWGWMASQLPQGPEKGIWDWVRGGQAWQPRYGIPPPTPSMPPGPVTPTYINPRTGEPLTQLTPSEEAAWMGWEDPAYAKWGLPTPRPITFREYVEQETIPLDAIKGQLDSLFGKGKPGVDLPSDFVSMSQQEQVSWLNENAYSATIVDVTVLWSMEQGHTPPDYTGVIVDPAYVRQVGYGRGPQRQRAGEAMYVPPDASRPFAQVWDLGDQLVEMPFQAGEATGAKDSPGTIPPELGGKETPPMLWPEPAPPPEKKVVAPKETVDVAELAEKLAPYGIGILDDYPHISPIMQAHLASLPLDVTEMMAKYLAEKGISWNDFLSLGWGTTPAMGRWAVPQQW